MPRLNELRQLAAVLPPSERVFANEASDLLSAVVALIEHGQPIIEAVKRGGSEAVYDLLHAREVTLAQQEGREPPQRGQSGAITPTPAVSEVSALAAQVAALTKLVTEAVGGHSVQPPQPSPAPPVTSSPSVAADHPNVALFDQAEAESDPFAEPHQ